MDRRLLIGIGGAGQALATQVQAVLGGALLLVDQRLANAPTAGAVSATMATAWFGLVPSATQARVHLEAQRAVLVTEIGDAPVVFCFMGLGGAVGSGAGPAVVRTALELGCQVHAVVTLPFDHETEAAPNAREALTELKATGVALKVHDHAATAAARHRGNPTLEEIQAKATVTALSYCGAQP